ncbi:hypothetical protein [Loktanella salsilacus]|uniref:hypothetical protein n=1 Tax=Loktanella salsilacus TaxID=195913 RepID=UPI0020B825DA|nr:hypothetical protein [Loktanella salsilacus]UTH46346.1 hypothetical protein KBK07_18060 [Loktanella salsilacus]
MIILICAELLARVSGSDLAQTSAWFAAGCIMWVARWALGLREAYLLALCGVLTLFLILRNDHPLQDVAVALDQATFMMAFILLMALLHEAASTSPSIEKCGRYMANQPPARRYNALYLGTGTMAVLFNLGVVSFLVPLVQRGINAATPDSPRNVFREQRQIGAVLRGFAWSVIWSPTAIAPLALVELIPGANRTLWIGLGFAIYILVMLMGAFEDRLRFRNLKPNSNRQIDPFPYQAALMFLSACGFLFGIILLAIWVTQGSFILGLMLACPVMLISWLIVQYSDIGHPNRPLDIGEVVSITAKRLHTIVTLNLPKAAPIAVTLACSGFVGRTAAALINSNGVAEALHLYDMPDYVLLSLIPVVLSLLGLFALSPIMTAIFFGSLFGSLDVMPADPTLVALSISCGWALSMTFSPFATVVLLIDRVAGIRPTTSTWRWNFTHSCLSAMLLVPVFAFLALSM